MYKLRWLLCAPHTLRFPFPNFKIVRTCVFFIRSVTLPSINNERPEFLLRKQKKEQQKQKAVLSGQAVLFTSRTFAFAFTSIHTRTHAHAFMVFRRRSIFQAFFSWYLLTDRPLYAFPLSHSVLLLLSRSSSDFWSALPPCWSVIFDHFWTPHIPPFLRVLFRLLFSLSFLPSLILVLFILIIFSCTKNQRRSSFSRGM